MLKLIWSTIVFLSLSALADDSIHFMSLEDKSLSLGNFTQFAGDIQEDQRGRTNKINFWPYMSFHTTHHLYQDFIVMPELAIAQPQRAETAKITKYLGWLKLDLGYQRWDFIFRAGGSLYVQRTSGEGGTMLVANGAGTTEFYIPSYSTTAMNFTQDLGVEYMFYNHWSTRAQMFTYTLLEDKTRAYNYTLSITYHLDKIRSQ